MEGICIVKWKIQLHAEAVIRFGIVKTVTSERRMGLEFTLCNYGCDQQSQYKLKNGKQCCSKSSSSCPEVRKRIKRALKNKKSQGWVNHTDETKQKMRDAALGKKRSKKSIEKQFRSREGYQHSVETIQKIRSGNVGLKRNLHTREKIRLAVIKRHKDPNDYLNSKERRKSQSKFLKDGHAAHMNFFIQNPSKPQKELYFKILKLCPYAILNYPCLNYSIDIAIPFLNIAMEYDGSYWHRDVEADRIRQGNLEREGWNFIRYRDYIPTTEELKTVLEGAKLYAVPHV